MFLGVEVKSFVTVLKELLHNPVTLPLLSVRKFVQNFVLPVYIF